MTYLSDSFLSSLSHRLLMQETKFQEMDDLFLCEQMSPMYHTVPPLFPFKEAKGVDDHRTQKQIRNEPR